MKIYTLLYCANMPLIIGAYSSFENAKKALFKEMGECGETLNVSDIEEGHVSGYYPLLYVEAYYQIICSDLDDIDSSV